jgi:hypothetical protein
VLQKIIASKPNVNSILHEHFGFGQLTCYKLDKSFNLLDFNYFKIKEKLSEVFNLFMLVLQ